MFYISIMNWNNVFNLAITYLTKSVFLVECFYIELVQFQVDDLRFLVL